MARKRGGLAGLYDRNKKVLQMLAPVAAGVFTGGAGGALVGGLMRGLDREGKRGIGLDVGQASRGALEGYGMGKLGRGARAGIGKMLAPRTPDALGMDLGLGRQAMAPMGGTGGASLPPMSMASAPMDRLPSVALPSEPTPSPRRSVASRVGGAATKALDFAKEYEKPLGALTQGVLGQLPSPEVEARQAQTQLERDRFDEELRQMRLVEERQALLAELLMPILQRRMAGPSAMPRRGASMDASFD